MNKMLLAAVLVVPLTNFQFASHARADDDDFLGSIVQQTGPILNGVASIIQATQKPRPQAPSYHVYHNHPGAFAPLPPQQPQFYPQPAQHVPPAHHQQPAMMPAAPPEAVPAQHSQPGTDPNATPIFDNAQPASAPGYNAPQFQSAQVPMHRPGGYQRLQLVGSWNAQGDLVVFGPNGLANVAGMHLRYRSAPTGDGGYAVQFTDGSTVINCRVQPMDPNRFILINGQGKRTLYQRIR